MAIPSKGSRRIVVDGVAYHWRIRARPTYSQGLGMPLSFAVAQARQGGTSLLVQTDGARPDNWVAHASTTVTPSLVAHAIRLALAQGWQPSQKGNAHHVKLPMPKAPDACTMPLQPSTEAPNSTPASASTHPLRV